MFHLLNDDVKSWFVIQLYRGRFLIVYVCIGIMSLVVEMMINYSLINYSSPPLAKFLSACVGIVFAFVFNAFFNFKIPRNRLYKGFLYFVLISLGSLSLNFLLQGLLTPLEISYAESRIFLSGCIFYFAYILHRKISFKEFKKVGVAIYADETEDISGIFKKVGPFPDFIHVDIVDSSYSERAPDPKIYRLETIQAYWRNKEIHCHIMSRTPSVWLEKVLPYVDICIITKVTRLNLLQHALR